MCVNVDVARMMKGNQPSSIGWIFLYYKLKSKYRQSFPLKEIKLSKEVAGSQVEMALDLHAGWICLGNLFCHLALHVRKTKKKLLGYQQKCINKVSLSLLTTMIIV